MHLSQLLVDQLGGLNEQLRHCFKFALAATGQQRYHGLARTDLELLSRCRSIGGFGQHVGQRMSDICRRHADLIVDRGFERKQAQHLGGRPCHLVDALAAPRPERWADVVHSGNATPTQGFFQSQIEVGCVDTNEQVWRIGEQARAQIVADPQNGGQLAQHLDVATDRERLCRVPDFEAGGLHFGPTDAHELRGWQSLPERFQQMRAE